MPMQTATSMGSLSLAQCNYLAWNNDLQLLPVLVGRITKLVNFRSLLTDSDIGEDYVFTDVSSKERYSRYSEIVGDVSSMKVDLNSNFCRDVKRFESQLSASMFYRNNNKNGENKLFLSEFGFRSFQKLSLMALSGQISLTT